MRPKQNANKHVHVVNRSKHDHAAAYTVNCTSLQDKSRQSSSWGCQIQDAKRAAAIERTRLRYAGVFDSYGSPAPTPAPPPECKKLYGATKSKLKSQLAKLDKEPLEFVLMYDRTPDSAEARFASRYPSSRVALDNDGQGQFEVLKQVWRDALEVGPKERGSHVKVSLRDPISIVHTIT